MPLTESWYARDARSWTCEAPDAAAADFHRQLHGYAPTPLVEVPDLAAELGVGRLFVKDESARFDLRAFKFLGASWAGFLAVSHRSGYAGPAGLDGLRAHLAAADGGLALVTATDGNHGRAVARTARLLGLPARVFVPDPVPGIVFERTRAEGARVTVVGADYDGAVAAARADADTNDGAVLVQDTAWPGYEEIPAWIVAGYETLFAELDAQLLQAGAPVPALVSVPVGVGSLDAAIAVDDAAAATAITSLAAAGITAGPSGAAALAALRAALTGNGAPSRRRDLGLDVPGDPPVAVCLCTEGPLRARGPRKWPASGGTSPEGDDRAQRTER